MSATCIAGETGLPAAMQAFLRELGLDEKVLAARALTGGVSSDIWLIETQDQRLCMKRALPALRVAANWQAPVERSTYEYAWMTRVRAILPQAVPRLLGRSVDGAMFAMAFLDPRDYPVWKEAMLGGKIDPLFAGKVGATLATIHSTTAKDASIAPEFASDRIFHAIRLEPYLLATAQRHPDIGPQLRALAERTASTKQALVHGDVSPKNILIGSSGPVFLDAECAWHGDPAFDVAFCLNHLMLKCIPLREYSDMLRQAFAEFSSHYLARVDWERVEDMEERCATLLPALTLARIDGKSPVEYVVAQGDKGRVREIARALIAEPRSRLGEVADAWHRGVTKH
ncbi:MAG: aminoglycoside phosphotransferase family protein [Methylobacteriaceae bacterium]|nr:aminoglycoside phosphotransferase family protein [Methylobacteriaceae bacterium]